MVRAGLFVIQHRIPLVDALLLRSEEVVGGIEDFDFLDFVALLDRVDDILALRDAAEDGVFAIEPSGRHMSDEKLAAIGAGAGVGH